MGMVAEDQAVPVHIQRVIEEKNELDTKIDKLNRFFGTKIFAGMTGIERGLMKSQHHVMSHYSQILGDRLAEFHNPSPAIGGGGIGHAII